MLFDGLAVSCVEIHSLYWQSVQSCQFFCLYHDGVCVRFACDLLVELVTRLKNAEDQMWDNVEKDDDLMKDLLQIPLHSFVSGKQQTDAIERVLNGLKRKIAMFKWQYRELLELISSTAVQNAGERIQTLPRQCTKPGGRSRFIELI